MKTRIAAVPARLGLALVLGICAGGAALAQASLPKEGTYEYIACWTGTSNDLSLGKESANAYELVGTSVSMVPGGFGDRNTFRCVGSNTMLKGKLGGGNVCEATDLDGDKRIGMYQALPDGKFLREFVAGTGKYEGMTVTTVIANMPPMKETKPGTFHGCNRQSGTYKLK